MSNPEESPTTVNVYPTRPRSLATTIFTLSATYIKDAKGTRDHLPEPFDIVDHIGNVSLSFMIASVATATYALKYHRNENEHESSDEKSIKRKVRLKLALIGGTAGIAINTYTETRLGLSLNPFFSNSTPDVTDLTYGMVGAIAGGAFGNKIEIQSSPEQDKNFSLPTE